MSCLQVRQAVTSHTAKLPFKDFMSRTEVLTSRVRWEHGSFTHKHTQPASWFIQFAPSASRSFPFPHKHTPSTKRQAVHSGRCKTLANASTCSNPYSSNMTVVRILWFPSKSAMNHSCNYTNSLRAQQQQRNDEDCCSFTFGVWGLTWSQFTSLAVKYQSITYREERWGH